MNGLPIVSLIMIAPVVGAMAILASPGRSDQHARFVGLLAATASAALAVVLWVGFDTSATSFQWEERVMWMPDFGISYHVGIDGISLLLVLLTALFVPITLVLSSSTISNRVHLFVVLILILETAIIGALVSLDLVLFYVFFEAMLVPVYLLIGIWGGAARYIAVTRFFLYTMAGSVVMLVAIIGVHQVRGTFDYVDFVNGLGKPGGAIAPNLELWLFGAFALAFAIKVPLVPLHSWLADTYAEAPISVTVLMSAVMVKVGTYGFLRFCMGMFPTAAQDSAWLIAVLATLGIVYGALIAVTQRDLRRFIAYSSLSHLGFVILGVVAGTTEAIQGSVVQMVNHGVSTGALFLLGAALHARGKSWSLADFGGLTRVMPVMAAIMVLVTFSSAGLPFTNGFTGEFLILTGTFRNAAWGLQPFAIVGATGIIFGAIYLLWMFQKIMQGPLPSALVSATDLTRTEFWSLLPLVVLIIWVGVYPKPFLDRTAPAVDQVAARLGNGLVLRGAVTVAQAR